MKYLKGINESFLQKLSRFGIKGHAFGKHAIRFVFHLDISTEQVDRLETILRKEF